MLTAAAILMSLGTNAASGHSVPTGTAGAESALFAESFREGAKLAGGLQPETAGGNPQVPGSEEKLAGAKGTASGSGLASGKPMPGIAQADSLIKEAIVTTKTLPQPIAVKMAASSSGKVTLLAEALRSKTKIAGKDSPVAEGETPESQPAAGDAKSAAQGTPSDAADPGDATVEGETDVTATPVPVNLNIDVKEAMAEQKKAAAPESQHDVASTIAEAKGHDSAAKATKAAKPEDKQEKAVAVAESAGNVQAATVAAVPSVGSVVNAQGSGASVAQDDASAPVPAVVAKQNIGAAGHASRRGAREIVVAKKPEEGANDVPAPVDDAGSHKVETDGKKVTASVTSEDPSKIQDVGTAASAVHTVHAETVTTVASTGAAGAVAMHVAGPGAQAADAGVHGGAASQNEPRSTEAAPQMLQATPNSLEVGVASGTHGWLKIRAEMSGAGVVNASLSTASSSGQEMLHRELPSLTAYLQSERVAVHTVVVQPVAAAAAMSREFGGRMSGDGRRAVVAERRPGRRETAGESRHHVESHEHERGVSRPDRSRRDELLSPAIYMAGGGWLSVRA